METRTVVRKEVRATRMMVKASMFLGIAAVAMMVGVALRQPSEMSGYQQDALPDRGAHLIELAASLDANQMQEHGLRRGWYKTYLDSNVRSEEAPRSQEIQAVPARSLVYVAQVKGHQARVLHPVAGWMRMLSEDGVATMRPDMTYRAPVSNDAIQDAFNSPEVLEATEKLKATSAKLTQVQRQLLGTLKTMREAEHHVKAARQDPKKAAEVLKRHATNAVQQAKKPDGARDLLQQLAKHPNMKPFVQGSKQLMGHAKDHVAVLNNQR